MYDGGKGGSGTILQRGSFFTGFTDLIINVEHAFSQLEFVVKFLDLNCIFLQDNVQKLY